MDRKILFLLIGAVIGFLISWKGCGDRVSNGGPETVISIDTVRHETVHDTTWHDTTKFTYITVETPVIRYRTIYDTVKFDLFDDDNFDYMMRYPAVYQDSMIKDDTVYLSYKATVRGYLDKIELGYKIVKPFLIESTTVTDIEIVKVKRPISFYMGFNVGANAAGPTQFSPMAELATSKMSYGLGYDIYSQAVVISVKARISFRRKPRVIPIP